MSSKTRSNYAPSHAMSQERFDQNMGAMEENVHNGIRWGFFWAGMIWLFLLVIKDLT